MIFLCPTYTHLCQPRVFGPVRPVYGERSGPKTHGQQRWHILEFSQKFSWDLTIGYIFPKKHNLWLNIFPTLQMTVSFMLNVFFFLNRSNCWVKCKCLLYTLGRWILCGVWSMWWGIPIKHSLPWIEEEVDRTIDWAK